MVTDPGVQMFQGTQAVSKPASLDAQTGAPVTGSATTFSARAICSVPRKLPSTSIICVMPTWPETSYDQTSLILPLEPSTWRNDVEV